MKKCMLVLAILFYFMNANSENILLTPEKRAENVSCFPDFIWQNSAWGGIGKVDLFEIQISTDKKFKQLIVTDRVELPRYVPANPLAINSEYYWRVRCVQGDKHGEWSETGMFSVANFANKIITIDASKSIDEVRKLFIKAKNSAPATIILSEDVIWSAKEIDLLNLVGFKNVWFEGNGKNITVTNPLNRLFHLDHCENIIFSNFTVDYSPLTHVPVVVTDSDIENNQITVKVIQTKGNRSLEFNDPRVLSAERQHMRLLDIENPGAVAFNSETYIHGPNQKYIRTYEKDGDLYHVIQFITKRYSASDFKAGDTMLRVIRGNSRNTMRASRSQHVAMYNITAYASPSQFASCIDGSGLIVQNCKVDLKEGRFSSITADIVYVRRNEIGPWVCNNVFNANGDDCMNFHSIASKIISKLNDKTLELHKSQLDRMDIGDEVAIWASNPGTVEPIYTTIKYVDKSSNLVTFNESVGEVMLSDKNPGLNASVYNISKSNKLFYVKNNHIKNNARFGILLSSQDGVIIDNTFERCASSGIRIGNLPGEGLNAGNVLIKGNEFINCGYTKSYFEDELGVIQICGYGGRYKEVPLKFHHNISIVGNKISDWESVVVKIRACTNVLVKDNIIQSGNKREFLNPMKKNNVFVVGNAANITFQNNIINDERAYNNYIIEEAGVSGLKTATDQ